LGLKWSKGILRSEIEAVEHGTRGLLEGAIKFMARKRANGKLLAEDKLDVGALTR
jgi:hypothetical protein